MKKICKNGFKISSVDKKALEHYLIVSPNKWCKDALNGMINKSIKTILNDWYEVYKSKQETSVSTDYTIIIPGIINMEEFTPYKHNSPQSPKISRMEPQAEEILEEGFDVEDHEELALKAYYNDPEATLKYFIENKIYLRRKAFVKEEENKMINDPNITEIPAKQDDFINMVCSKPEYKNRAEREAELIL